MKILEPKTFSKEDIEGMRETLHESEWEGMKDRHLRHLRQMTWEGCVGWKNIPDAEVVEHYQNIYGESSNYKMIQGVVNLKEKKLVICDKNINEQQGKIIAKFKDIK